ncbi:hypothetical protein [Bradyrhizobium jicamae]|uniref:hypothetical protein n=1 Tax=Bradyrhizobium jicamae TaxID=280332 RepID=UPI001BA63A60|nr:hypothetical protein [Bradyrhizobium jicamae]MBR0937243.1 hypothetical protein [Bradyrhizobium jicamae]
MEFPFLWVGLSIVDWVAAYARGRDGAGWLLLVLIIAPVIALLLVLLMERVRRNTPDDVLSPPPFPEAVLEPDTAHAASVPGSRSPTAESFQG